MGRAQEVKTGVSVNYYHPLNFLGVAIQFVIKTNENPRRTKTKFYFKCFEYYSLNTIS